MFNRYTLLMLLGVGVFSYLYQLFMTSATKHAPVRLTGSFLYSGVIFAAFFEWLIWNVVPNIWSLVGTILVIVGACLLLFLYPKDDYKVRKKM